MRKFVEFHSYEGENLRVSVDVFSIVHVMESSILDSNDTITTLTLDIVVGLSGERMPATIAVRESYDDVMNAINKECDK